MVTTQGLVRFDGKHMQSIPGCPLANTRVVAASETGEVWVGGPDGLAVFQNGSWHTVFADPVSELVPSRYGLWVDTGRLRLLSPEGNVRDYSDVAPDGPLTVDSRQALWFVCGMSVCRLDTPDSPLRRVPIPIAGRWRTVAPESADRWWVGDPESVALVDHGRLVSRQLRSAFDERFGPVMDPLLAPDGTIWVSALGMHPESRLRMWNVLPNGVPRAAFDRHQGAWAVVGDLLWHLTPNDSWESWNRAAIKETIAVGFLKQDGQVSTLLSDHGTFDFNPQTRNWQWVPGGIRLDVLAAVDDGFGGRWIITREEGLLRTNHQWVPEERVPMSCKEAGIRALLRDARGRVFVGGKGAGCFFEVRGSPGRWQLVPQDLPEGTLQAVELKTDRRGRPWVGYQYGLAYLDDDGRWNRIRTSEPVTMIRSFDFDGDDVIWFSRRLTGYFGRLERHGDTWTLRRFPAGQYPPADSWIVHRDSRGYIWRGSTQGYQVAEPDHLEPGEWLALTPRNGLSSTGECLRCLTEDSDGNIWLGGSQGITRVKPDSNWFRAPAGAAPIITRITAGRRQWFDPASMPATLPTGTPVEIDFAVVDATPFRSSAVRYRLLPDRTQWSLPADATARFSKLTAGDHTLEVAYAGDGQPEIRRWQVHVAASSTWMLPLSLSLASLALLAPFGWRKRDYLRYWLEKPLFLLSRMVRRQPSGVTWNNYTGHTFADRYRLEEVISRGGFSITYRGRDLHTRDSVVVKVLHRSPGQESWSRHRFAHEVAALHTVSHPGVVPLLDSWITRDGEPCLAMPFLDGPTLRQWLTQTGPADPNVAASIVRQLGAALSAIHARGIVHRDLKPENIILREPGTPSQQAVIIDFGTSAARGPELHLEETTTVSGSIHYLAPERLARQYSPASDLYALGVIVLEMLTGKRPSDIEVSPADPAFVKVIAAVTGEAPARLIAAALRHHPAQRPTDLDTWTSELAEALSGGSTARGAAPSN